MSSEKAFRLTYIWRLVALAAFYIPWVYLNMMLAFLVMYSPVVIQLPILWGFSGLYGVISFVFLKGVPLSRLMQGFIVPLPVLIYLFWSDLQSTNDIERAIRWFVYFPVYSVGLVGAMLYLKHRNTSKKKLEN